MGIEGQRYRPILGLKSSMKRGSTFWWRTELPSNPKETHSVNHSYKSDDRWGVGGFYRNEIFKRSRNKLTSTQVWLIISKNTTLSEPLRRNGQNETVHVQNKTVLFTNTVSYHSKPFQTIRRNNDLIHWYFKPTNQLSKYGCRT